MKKKDALNNLAQNIFTLMKVCINDLDHEAVARDEEAIVACLEDFITLVHAKYKVSKRNGNKN